MTGKEFINAVANGQIQIQTDSRYQDFIPNAHTRKVLGYEMKVATLDDVLKGKLWAYLDDTRRKSKKQKDLADITRLTETYPTLVDQLPEEVRKLVE